MSSSRGKPHVAPFAGPAWPLAAAWLLAALVAQATLLHFVALRGVVPSAVLVVVVWYALRVDALRAAAYGLAAGFLEDALAGVTGGSWTIATTVTAALTSLMWRSFFADSIPTAAAAVLVATLLRAWLFWTAMSYQGYPGGLAGMHAREAAFGAVVNAILMILATIAARRVDVRRA